MFRWPNGADLWELVYLAIHSVGHTGIITTCFVAISVATPKSAGAGPITTYYMSQQIGMVVGVTASSVFTRDAFRNILIDKLADHPYATEVGIFGSEKAVAQLMTTHRSFKMYYEKVGMRFPTCLVNFKLWLSTATCRHS